MNAKCFFVVASLVALSSGIPQWAPSDSHSQVAPQSPFMFRVGLKQQNLDYLEKLFWEISDPENPLFGQFLSHDQLATLISLPEDQIAEVESYIMKGAGEHCDVKVERSLHRDSLYVHTCAAQAKTIMPNLDLISYKKEDVTEEILRSPITMDPRENLFFLGVPSEIHPYLEGIYDVTDHPPHYERGGSSKPSPNIGWLSSDKELTINEIIDYFGVNMDDIEEESLKADHPQVRQAVLELDNTAFVASGLTKFQEHYHIRKDPVAKVVGSQKVTFATIEADLDVQTITALAQGAQTWSFVFPASASWVDVAEGIMATEGAPRIISSCWFNFVSTVGTTGLQAGNVAMMKLGLAGFTWLNAAGDSGPLLDPQTCDTFTAKFPSVSPYVVAVGGAKVTEATGVEGAWFRSGGGFSDNFARPAFQQEAVKHYLETTQLPPNPQGKRYQTSGRAFPDIAGFSAYYPIYFEGELYPVAGTSAATPQLAGILTLIQIQRYQKGLGPLGPITQTLYKLEDGVGVDIVEGQTYAVGRGYCTNDILPGFYAAKGWDAATGLGLPKYDVLAKQLVPLGQAK